MRHKKIPLPVTVNDCMLLWQMGYNIQINDGNIIKITKRKAPFLVLKQKLSNFIMPKVKFNLKRWEGPQKG